MSFQRELFAIVLIFTWCVEMKLLQCKSIVVQTQGITFTNVNLNSMAIVDYLLFTLLENQNRFAVMRFQCPMDIDR